MIKGLIFDLDGVISKTDYFHYLAWKKELLKHGIEFSEKENEKLKGLSRIKTLKEILKSKNINFNEEKIVKIANKKNQIFIELLTKKLSEKHLLPNIKKLIIDAKEKNLKLAIASSSYNAPLILRKLGLYNLFDFIVNPANVKKGKPDPEIFLKAAEGLNLKPEQAVGFEDAVAGIEGLNKANIKSVAITHGIDKNLFNADLIVKSTKELNLDIIFKLFN